MTKDFEFLYVDHFTIGQKSMVQKIFPKNRADKSFEMQIHNFCQLGFFLKIFLTILFGFFDKGFLIFKCESIHNLSISAILVPVRQKLDKR